MTLSGELKINSKNVSHHAHYILANMFNTVSFIFFYNSSPSNSCVPTLQTVGKKKIRKKIL